MLDGSEFKACLPGGASTGFLPRQHYHIEMDFDALKKVGNRLGTGAIMVFDHKTCLVAATLNLMEFFARESCGWCTPCREGLPYIRDLLARIEAGEGRAGIRSHAGGDEGPPLPLLLRLRPGGGRSAGEPARAFQGRDPGAHPPEKRCPFKGKDSRGRDGSAVSWAPSPEFIARRI
ncbi:MAG: hypothetical protein MZV70_71505 [Desulfobacterales bacterium]|nr:hypothetical protein [Desulfobacterales bacterium]